MKQFVLFGGIFSVLISCGEKSDTAQETEEDTPEEDTSEVDTSEEDTSNSVEEDVDTDEEAIEDWEGVCDLITQEKTIHELPASQDEAPQLILVPENGESYSLTKEASSDGWFILEVPIWMCDVEFYTSENVQIELEASSDWELGEVGAPISACEDTDVILHSWTFHAWGNYVVHIQAENQTEFWLATRLVE